MTKRAKRPSNSVVKGAAVGTPWSILTTFVSIKLAEKFAIPADVASVAIGALVTGVQSLAQYFARGGRHGEAD